MAIIRKYALAAVLTPTLDVGPHWVTRKQPVINADAAITDVIELLTFEKAGTIFRANLAISATLGAGCTAKLVIGDGTTNVDVSLVTTAGAASKVTGNDTVEFVAGAKLFVLIAGAGITAAATIRADVLVQY